MLSQPFEKPIRVWVGLGFPRQLNTVVDAYPVRNRLVRQQPRAEGGYPRLQGRFDRRHRCRDGQRCFRCVRAQEGHIGRGRRAPSRRWLKPGFSR